MTKHILWEKNIVTLSHFSIPNRELSGNIEFVGLRQKISNDQCDAIMGLDFIQSVSISAFSGKLGLSKVAGLHLSHNVLTLNGYNRDYFNTTVVYYSLVDNKDGRTLAIRKDGVAEI